MSLWRKMSRKIKKILHIKWFKKGGGEDDAEQQVLVIGSPTDFQHVQGFSTSTLRSVQTITIGAEAGVGWAFDHGQAATGQLGHVDEDGTALEEEDSHDDDYKDGVVHENNEQHGRRITQTTLKWLLWSAGLFKANVLTTRDYHKLTYFYYVDSNNISATRSWSLEDAKMYKAEIRWGEVSFEERQRGDGWWA
ncbi:hypothetical protein E8E13_010439 [Curvularia kusanoi]|uniref:Uncharacterized protein n=1 Tax=Curvularia kusanoi TaxID=90978 RepID=A0A9P4TJA3_CURKU|nr:hypothetical protein E8E13_010439 [Curvularia kusanoi]